MTAEEMKVIGGVCLQFEWHYGWSAPGENIAVLCFVALTSNFVLYQPEWEVIQPNQENESKSMFLYMLCQSLSSVMSLKLKVLMPENF